MYFFTITYVQAVNSGANNLDEILLSSASQKQLVPLGPRIVKQTSKARKTIDSENLQKRCLAQENGTLITESKKTTEHEIIADEDIPQDKLADNISIGSHEKIYSREAKQRYFKQRDEQNVDLLLDGKLIDTEMRYAAETAQIEKEGSLERPGDWDSLSDRMRKMRTRTQQKTLMQQQKAVLLADRKDALTKRPLDFDREEETRKGETMKWLESHFGSESTASNDSREDIEPEIEPTKKTYFNVTIKSGINNATSQPTSNGYKPSRNSNLMNNNYANNKYYQGISNWSDRKEAPALPTSATIGAANANTPVSNHFSSKAFRDDLRNTVERNRLRKNGVVHKTLDVKDYVSREDILQQKRQSLSAQYLARTRRESRDKLDEPDTSTLPKTHNGINNARTDPRTYKMEAKRTPYLRANTMDTRQSPINFNSTLRNTNDYHDMRAKSYEHELNDNHTIKYVRRSPSPETVRPSVPQRRRAIEKKLRQQHATPAPLKIMSEVEQVESILEPPPDYSPPPRSRSSTPPLDYDRNRARIYTNDVIEVNTLQRKPNQRTRFAPAPPRQSMATQTTQTTPSNISTSTATGNSHKSTRRVGQVIGNSLRKLVSKIRSASAERKLRLKSKSKSREQSPAPPMLESPNGNSHANGNMSTYQQYNRQIDSHIGGQAGSNESERESSLQPESSKLDRENESLAVIQVSNGGRRRESAASDHINNPRQRYYLGEDPYSSSLYGKENMYDAESLAKRQRATRSQIHEVVTNGVHHETRRDNSDYNQQRGPPSTTTLGRYQKMNNRFVGSTPNLTQPDYRTTQTLPRKLHEPSKPTQHTHYQYHRRQATPTSSYGTLGHPDRRASYQQNQAQPLANTGPAKPARTYAKALNRSRSFSVHGMNGTADPSPVYMEKLNRHNYNNNNSYNGSNLSASQAYKSNPHIFSGGGGGSKESSTMLKSPSIVNLISRSQRDLTKIGNDEHDNIDINNGPSETYHYYKSSTGHNRYDADARKPSQYQLRAKHSLPVEFNRDTASIIRNENDYNTMQKRPVLMYRDDHKRRGSATIIEVRHK